jgi:undecaprenyl-diphosphatase
MEKILNIDTSIFRAINGVHFSLFHSFMFIISLAGELATIWFVIAVIILYKNKKDGKKIFVLMTLAIIMTLLIDHIIIAYFLFRDRPYIALQDVYQLGKRWTDSSFPSGHVSSAMAATVVIGQYYKKYFPYMIGFVILTMISRVNLGMHYPLDVIGGVVVGLISGYLILYLYKIFFNRRSV